MNPEKKYKMVCTLTFGDIYGQIIVWLGVIFISLASTLALWSATRQMYAFVTIALVLVISLPFLVFAFVSTLFNHIEFIPLEENQSSKTSANRQKMSQNPIQAIS